MFLKYVEFYIIVNTSGARLAYVLMCVSYIPRFLCVETSFTVLPLGPKRNRGAACASKQASSLLTDHLITG